MNRSGPRPGSGPRPRSDPVTPIRPGDPHPVGRHACRDQADRGAAVVEFVLVSVLLVFLVLGVVQVALVVHVRDVLVADAAEGARYAADRGVGLAAGEQRCAEFVRESLSPALVGPLACQASLVPGEDGLTLVRMAVAARVPLTVLPLGQVRVAVTARAVEEP